MGCSRPNVKIPFQAFKYVGFTESDMLIGPPQPQSDRDESKLRTAKRSSELLAPWKAEKEVSEAEQDQLDLWY